MPIHTQIMPILGATKNAGIGVKLNKIWVHMPAGPSVDSQYTPAKQTEAMWVNLIAWLHISN